MASLTRLLFSSFCLFYFSEAAKPCPDPRVVDLGYAKHVPTLTNYTASGKKISVYKNIRFGNPPTGELRFRLPNTNLPKTDGIQDGRVAWQATECISSAPEFVPYPNMAGKTWGHEDCLFLDVYVPEGVKPGDNVPVLHWIVGSAFAFGSKETFTFFNPLGLFDVMDNRTKFIFVANNYRLGVPGWAFVPGRDMEANVGMHDCLAAAEWTSKYIRRFGGDPDRITAMGQSAGAGIISLLTVINGGRGRLPFQQAFISSVAIPPRRNVSERQEAVFQEILHAGNCTSLKCLRGVPETTMVDINNVLINQLPSDGGGGVLGPSPGFGPVLDGHYLPDLQQNLFRKGAFNKGLRSLVVGSMANEGMGTAHDTGMPEGFPDLVRLILHTASNTTVAEIKAHYEFGSNPAKLAWDWVTDVIFACNANNIASAYRDRARRYIMSIPPAVHAMDVSYYFYVDQETTPVGDIAQAKAFQRDLLQFLHGEEVDWPVYGNEMQIRNITEGVSQYVALPENLRDRCEMINRVVSDLSNGV